MMDAHEDPKRDVRRDRGRPRVDDPGVPVTTWMPTTEYTRLYRLAKRTRQSVSKVVRSLVILRLP